jgi:hypothetical protein
MNKRRARKAHLIRRARERFGLELTNEDLIGARFGWCIIRAYTCVPHTIRCATR